VREFESRKFDAEHTLRQELFSLRKEKQQQDDAFRLRQLESEETKAAREAEQKQKDREYQLQRDEMMLKLLAAVTSKKE
jgi:hypothetical protein